MQSGSRVKVTRAAKQPGRKEILLLEAPLTRRGFGIVAQTAQDRTARRILQATQP